MTWKEIKDKIESEGVKDNSQIRFIDISDDVYEVNDLIVEEIHGIWEITN